jgi:hypothetical protein
MPRDDLWAIAFLAAEDMDDISGFSLLHARQNALDREKCRGEIAVNRCAPPFLGCLLQRGCFRRGLSVCHTSMDTSQRGSTTSLLRRDCASGTEITRPNAAGTLSRKSVRTVRRSLISDVRKLGRSCWRRCHKVQSSLFRKVSSSWKTPGIHSGSTIQSRSQQRKARCRMRGDMPFG